MQHAVGISQTHGEYPHGQRYSKLFESKNNDCH